MNILANIHVAFEKAFCIPMTNENEKAKIKSQCPIARINFRTMDVLFMTVEARILAIINKVRNIREDNISRKLT